MSKYSENATPKLSRHEASATLVETTPDSPTDSVAPLNQSKSTSYDPHVRRENTLTNGFTSEPIIPNREEFPHRTLVLCFDGTGDQFDSDVS